jgi:hypothetical protein
MDETFDITNALRAMRNANLETLSLVVVPYSLLAVPGTTTIPVNRKSLSVGGLQLLTTE